MADTYTRLKIKFLLLLNRFPPILSSLMLMSACLEVLAIINGYILSSSNNTSRRLLIRSEKLFFLTKYDYDELYTSNAYIVHLNRYPSSLMHFNYVPSYAEPLSLSNKKYNTINGYDNSVAYTDFILRQIFSMLEKQKRPVALLYFSDSTVFHTDMMLCHW